MASSLTSWLRRKATARSPAAPFHLVLTFYQRDPAYALGLACISAYVKRELAGVRVHLVPLFKGDDVARWVDEVLALAPDLVAVSAMHPTWLPAHPYLEALRRAAPRTPFLVGGYQAMVSPAETLAHPAVDYVCAGDGEEPTVALIRRLRGETDPDAPLPGLWERTAGGGVRTAEPVLVQDLRRMPFPDYTIFERAGQVRYLSPHAVESKRLTTLPVISGRGCPYRCTYCANTTLLDMFGGKNGLLRKYEPEPLVDELVRLRDRYGVQYFQFWDEEFLYERRYAARLLARYRERVGVPFSMFARVESMNDELCGLAAAAGCHAMWFGMESGSEDYRRRYLNRRMTNAQILAGAESARRHGIKRFAFNMVGMPFETADDIRGTLALTRAIAPELTVFSQYLPLPGTPLYELVRRHDLLLPPSADRQMWPLGRLNVREHAPGVSAGEMRLLGDEIMGYLRAHTACDD